MAGSGPQAPVGILAGGGVLPIEVAEAVSRSGRRLHIVGIEGEADAVIERFPHTWVNWGGIGAMVGALRDNGCKEIVIVGRVRRPNLMGLRPDLGFVASFPSLLRFLRGGDDSVLRRVVRFFESKGFTVIGVEDVAPHLLAPPGPLGSHAPGPAQVAAIARAFSLIRALGPFDVGQAVVIAGDRVVAIEGAGGTDAMLRDIAADTAKGLEQGAGGPARGAVLVKGPKPGQELRVDLPVIGPETVTRSAALQLAGIAVPKGRAIILQRDELLRRADAAGLFVVGVDAPIEPIREPDARSAENRADNLAVLGRRSPATRDWKDIALGQRLLRAMKAERAGHSAVIARQHVLAVEGDEATAGVAARAGRLKQWGRWLARGRVGVLVVRDQDYRHSGLDRYGQRGPVLDDHVFHAAAEAGLAGIACVESPIPGVLAAETVARADAAGFFLVAPKAQP
jgi:DUF1009 family protein